MLVSRVTQVFRLCCITWALIAPMSLLAAPMADLHRMTLPQLTEVLKNEAANSPKAQDVKLAMARKIGQTDQKRAVEILSGIDENELTPSQLVYATAMRCEINIRQGKMAIALPFCEELREHVEKKTGDTESRALAYNALGYFYIRQGKPEEAIKLFELALKLPDVDDDAVRVTLLHNRGVSLMLAGLTELAIERCVRQQMICKAQLITCKTSFHCLRTIRSIRC